MLKKILPGIFLAILMALSGTNSAGAQNLAFTTNSFSVGGEPTSVVAADVNGDGKLDLVSANFNTNNDGTLTVLTNNGSGVFGSNATLNIGGFPLAITVADISGDGKVDLITANNNSNSPTILTNNGYGSFGSNATLNVGSGVLRSIIAADVDGNGKLDLISADFDGNTLTIFTNNGSGIFGSNATLNVGNFPLSVVAADINGDGKLDLISANSDLKGPGTLSIFTNNGAGVFGSNATLVVGTHPVFVIAADVNGDGAPDLISVNQDDDTLTVLTNNGSGVFGSNATLNVGQSPTCVAAADINGDGKLDLICANTETNTLTILTNNGSGSFGFNTTLDIGTSSSYVIAADVNGDGKLDLISANPNNNTLTVLINHTVFPPPTSTPPLVINLLGNETLVSWPSTSAGWSLQQNPGLATTGWGPSGYSGYAISDNGTNKSLIIPSPMGNLFFRLLHP